MTQPPAPLQPLHQLEYAPNEFRNAKTLVLLATIFHSVMASIDVLYALVCLIIGIVGFWNSTHAATFSPPTPTLTTPTPIATSFHVSPSYSSSSLLISLIFGVPAFLSLVVAAVKLIAAVKFHRRSRGAWGWGLAAGIVSCVQIWMFAGCCMPVCLIPMPVGIFTIVILCLPHVRAYLAQGRETGSLTSP